VSDDTIYRALKDLGFAHLSARPRAYRQDPHATETPPAATRLSASPAGISAMGEPKAFYNFKQDATHVVLTHPDRHFLALSVFVASPTLPHPVIDITR
jgi:hypothetical protein